MSDDLVAEAIKACLPAIALGVSVHDADEVPGVEGNPGDRPEEWVEVGLTRTSGQTYRLAGVAAVTSYYVTTGVAARSVSNTREIEARIRARLEGCAAEIGSRATTPMRFYAHEPAERVSGLALFWSLTTWSFAL